jgi:hypothetical protein
MGIFSWLKGGKAPKKTGAAKPAPGKAAAKPVAASSQSREELIRNALKIREEKKREFDKLDPEVREKLLRQAMGKKNEED